MKKLGVFVCVLILGSAVLFAGSYPYSYGGYGESEWDFYFGLSTKSFEADGFKNARLSDYYYVPDPTTEGSLLLPLDTANSYGFMVGITAGAKTDLIDNIYALIEMSLNFGDNSTFAFQFNFGGLYYLLNDFLRFGVGAKIGFYSYNLALGKAQILVGTTPPVILPEGRIVNGDTLTFEALGFNLGAMVDVGIELYDGLSVGCMADYMLALPVGGHLSAGDDNKINIDPETSHAYYDPYAAGFVPLEMKPSASYGKVSFMIYACYSI